MMWKRLWNLLTRRKKASPAARVDRFKFYDQVKELDSILDEKKTARDPYDRPPWAGRKHGASQLRGDLNDNVLSEAAPDPPGRRVEPTRIEDGVVIFPGGVIFDPVEFRQFQKDHPEYSHCEDNPRPPSYTVKKHEPVNGVGVVGISPRGVVDPGLAKGILDELTKNDGE
jgi:hypothetical protein